MPSSSDGTFWARSAAAFEARWSSLAPNTRGAIWVLVSGVFFSVMGVLIKTVGARLDSFEIAFFRALFGFLAVLPFAIAGGVRVLKTRYPFRHAARAVIGVSAMFCGFYAVTHLTLADAVAFTFTKPLFLIPLAVLFLGERVRARRWSATAVGFLGVVVMVKPTGAMEHAAFIALLGAFLVAVVTVLVKQLAASERPTTILFYFGIVSTAVAAVPAYVVWREPTISDLVLLAALGVAGATAQGCMIRGFAVGEATAVVPFEYARLIFAAAFGFLLFAEVPDALTMAGAVIVVGSTLYIARREARLGKASMPPIVDQATPIEAAAGVAGGPEPAVSPGEEYSDARAPGGGARE